MFRYVPRTIPTKIFVIGCGGTGSRLVPLLSQFIKTVTAGVNPRGTVVDPVIYLIDNDIIEAKNLARQNFISSDVGKNKAEVLAQRYGRAYGVNIIPIPKRVTSGVPRCIHNLFSDLDVAPVHPGDNSLVIMCVDSAQARRDILSAWSTDRMRSAAYRRTADVPQISPVFIDAGNEDDFGQVRIFQRAVVSPETTTERKAMLRKLPSMRPEIFDIHCLPMDVEFYRNMVDNEGASCADLDQTLAINALMATLIMGMVQNLYYFKPFTYHSMSISLSGGVSVEHLTAEYLIGLADSSRGDFGETVTAFDTEAVIHEYSELNVRTLRRMGLKKDGTAREVQSTPLAAEASSEAVEGPGEPCSQEEQGASLEGDGLSNAATAEEVTEGTVEYTPSLAQRHQEFRQVVVEAVANHIQAHPELLAGDAPITTVLQAGGFAGFVNATGVAPTPPTIVPVVAAASAPTPAAPPPLRPGVVSPGHSLAA